MIKKLKTLLSYLIELIIWTAIGLSMTLVLVSFAFMCSLAAIGLILIFAELIPF